MSDAALRLIAQQFCAAYRPKPGIQSPTHHPVQQFNAGSSGQDTPHHLTLALLNDLQRSDIQQVRYKGVAPAITNLIGGQLTVPLTAEAGALQLPVESWTAVKAPTSTPEAMVAQLSAELLKIMATPDMDERGSAWGFRIDARGPQAFGKLLGDEILRVSHHRGGQRHDGAGCSCRVCVGRGRSLPP